jgi:hypothetical protein
VNTIKFKKHIRYVSNNKSGKSNVNNKGLGVVYWDPREKGWSGYSLSAWQSDGKPSAFGCV